MVYSSTSWYPGGITIQFEVGHGRVVSGELFQANCIDAIPDISFSKSEGSGMKNLTHDNFYLYYSYDASNSSIGDSVIFNEGTWEIDFCHAAFLVGSSPVVESEMTLKLDVELKPPGEPSNTRNAVTDSRSWFLRTNEFSLLLQVSLEDRSVTLTLSLLIN